MIQFYPWFKLITNRWAWALVPKKLVEQGNALAWGGGIHGNPVGGPLHVLSHWTNQWNTCQTTLNWPWPKGKGRDGKNIAQNGKQATSYYDNTLRITASKQLPLLEALGHPQHSWEKRWPPLLRGQLCLNYIYLHLPHFKFYFPLFWGVVMYICMMMCLK